MEEFLAGLLWMILEPLLEGLCEFVLWVISKTIVGLFWPDTSEGEPINFWTAVRGCAGYLLLGMLIGRLSLSVLPHPIFHHSPVPGLSVMVSPVVAGLLTASAGAKRWRWEKEPAAIESFSYGFFFAFGVAVIRFLWAK